MTRPAWVVATRGMPTSPDAQRRRPPFCSNKPSRQCSQKMRADAVIDGCPPQYPAACAQTVPPARSVAACAAGAARSCSKCPTAHPHRRQARASCASSDVPGREAMAANGHGELFLWSPVGHTTSAGKGSIYRTYLAPFEGGSDAPFRPSLDHPTGTCRFHHRFHAVDRRGNLDFVCLGGFGIARSPARTPA